MLLPILATAIIALGILSIILISEKKKVKKINLQIDSTQKNLQYILNVFKEIQDGVKYGSELENTIDIIAASLEKKFPYSTLSSVFIKKSKLVFKIQVRETVSHAFIERIKDNSINLFSLPTGANTAVDENITGAQLDDLSNSEIKSSFDIKLVSAGLTKAVINISSSTENLYSVEDKKLWTTISELLSGFITKVESLLVIEKSKALAMIDSFSEGIFMIDNQNNLVAMNDSAGNFLSIHSDNPTINDLLSALPNTYNFKDKIEQAMQGNHTIEVDDVPIKDKIFKILISPVLEIKHPEKNSPPIDRTEADVIGATLLLTDNTLEKSLAQTKEDFINIMVHELRSPLTAIHASSQFLQSQADFKAEEKDQLLHMVSESSKKMLDKISVILDSAKLDAGLFAIRKIPSDLKKLIMDRIAVFTPTASEKSISIKVDIDESLVNFLFDPMRIDEVVNNLLSNSLKFTPVNGTITVKVHQALGKVTVSVSDTGAGIPKDKQHLLFTKYQQAPTDGAHQGTGLGLYVVKGIVEAHGGTVSLESEPGNGTTISFTLPALTVSAQSPTTPSPTPAKSPSPMAN